MAAPRLALVALLLAAFAVPAAAHPVPKDSHDRTIAVHLCAGPRADEVVVFVEYRLEVDEFTVLLDDMKPYAEEVDFAAYRNRPLEYYAEFTKRYAETYASNLVATADGRPLTFTCVARNAQLRDEKDGTPLGHLRCDFLFRASFTPPTDRAIEFCLTESNYLLQSGQIVLSLVNESDRAIGECWEPDEAFRKRAAENPDPDDEMRLRSVRAVLLPQAVVAPTRAAVPAQAPPRATSGPTHDEEYSLLRLFLHTDYGIWLTLVMAFAFGAAHALTPGHGKTLVAAYLVGERGTIWHAITLGSVTTLTHTGIVLIIAAVLFFLPESARRGCETWLQHGLGLAMGLLVTGMGFWLLLQRLAGRADHFHVGGGHHHHHHGEPPVAAEQGPAVPKRSLTWWGLIVLGVSGGLVPCWDAIYLLLYTVGRSQFWIALPTVLAFSAGLAGVLVLIGIMVVQVPRFARSGWGHGRLVRALPLLSALVITAMGLWLCYEGVHGR